MAVLAVVDDLLFSSKIRATARQLGVDVRFARTKEEILTLARELKPSLVIVDLNSAKTDPIATITALKQDSGTEGIRTIGFASHVHTALIAEARQAGANEVMPRSSFAAHLGDILLASAAQS